MMMMIKKEEERVQEAEEEVDEEDDDERSLNNLELTPCYRKSLSLQCRYALIMFTGAIPGESR